MAPVHRKRRLARLAAALVLALASAAPAEENPSLFPVPTPVNLGIASDFIVDGSFASHLPLVVVEADPESGGAARDGARVLVYDADGRANTLLDAPAAEFAATLDPRPGLVGGKSGYRVSLAAADGVQPAPLSLMGLRTDGEWLLRGSLRDKSMLRNSIAYTFGKVLFPELTPEFRYCELLLGRDGRYRYEGIYVLAEDGDRILASLPDRMPGTPLLRNAPNQERRDSLAVRAGNKIFTAVQSGPDDDEKREARVRAGVDLARLESTLMSLSPAAFLRYESLLDVDSAINLYILNTLMLNTEDAPARFRLYMGTDGKFAFAPEWDFDEALDNRPTRDRLLSFEENFPRVQPPSPLSRRVPVWRELENGGDIRDLRIYPQYAAMGGDKFAWFDRLFLSRPFLVKLYERYHEVRRGQLSPERIRTLLEDLAFTLGPSLERDWLRWHREYATEESPYALRPFVDDKGRVHVRQTWSFDQELVKNAHSLLRQDGFIRDQLERLEWMTADLYDTGSTGNEQAAYAFAALFAMMILMYVLSKKL